MRSTSVICRAVLGLLLAGVGSTASAQSLGSADAAAPTGWAAPALHRSLAVGFVGLQALDVVTTLNGVGGGRGVEANPLLGDLANHPPALVAVKGALTTATLVSMRGLSKKHPKAAALAMIGVNAASVLVVRSNLRVVKTP